MKAASDGWPSGAGFIFFSDSIALMAMPLFGPSFAGRSNSTASTFALTRCAAICAPITPAPSTATFLTMKLLTCAFLASFFADPGLRAAEQRHAHVSPDFEAAAAVAQPHLAAIDLAVVGIEDAAALEVVVLDLAGLHALDDRHALNALVLARIGAQVADGVGLVGQDLLDPAGVAAARLDDANQGLGLLRLVVDVLPQTDRRSGRRRRRLSGRRHAHRQGGERGQRDECDSRLHRFLRTARLRRPSAAWRRRARCGSARRSRASAWRSRSARWPASSGTAGRPTPASRAPASPSGPR